MTGIRDTTELFETSLRDGLQQPNLEISVPAAIGLLRQMSRFGVGYAELGFAGANQFVVELLDELNGLDLAPMKLALFGRSRGRGVRPEDWPDVQFMLRYKTIAPVSVVVVKSRLLDVERSLETTAEESLQMATETIAHLCAHGQEVVVDLEHAMDALCGRREFGQPSEPEFHAKSLEYFHSLVASCLAAGASRLVVCDTTGGATPEEVADAIVALRALYPGARFGFHGHTDRGFGVANSRAAVLAGAVQVQGTLLGTGERCGNVNLTTLIGSMQLRDEARFVSDDQLRGLMALTQSAYSAFSLETPHGAPIVGAGAFGTWAGMHGSSERKNPGAYLWCEPERVGASAVIGVNSLSGRANIMALSESLGVSLSSEQAQQLIEANRAMVEGGGFTVSEVSFRLACMRILGTLRDRFSVRGWRVFDESDVAGDRFVQAFMTLAIGGDRLVTSRAVGTGPVDALTKALRQEIVQHHPAIQLMRLGTFSVKAIDVLAHDSAAHVRVTLSFHAEGHQPWITAGVSSDMNDAALMAILDGFHYWLHLAETK